MQKLKTAGVVALVLAGVLAGTWPWVAHFIDRGQTRVPATALSGDFHPASRNLVVDGRLEVGYRVERTVTDENGRTKNRQNYYPLVAPGWTPNDPVRAVFVAHAWPGHRQEELAAAPAQTGVLRNIWWEGLTATVRGKLANEGLHLADEVLLIEEPRSADPDLQ